MSYYMHNVPGRLRIKSPLLKRPAVQDEVKKALSTLEGIGTTEFTTATGSLLVSYQPKMIHAQDIIDLLTRRGYFDPSQALTNDQYIRHAASRAGSFIGKNLLGTFVERALEGSALSFIALLI
ncbi:MAG: heavy-metal-associated domain-containing protein [Nitrospirales bacterium]|nr:heavy-metal-associated domain-containing protein [Nitrospirales bacterium]